METLGLWGIVSKPLDRSVPVVYSECCRGSGISPRSACPDRRSV